MNALLSVLPRDIATLCYEYSGRVGMYKLRDTITRGSHEAQIRFCIGREGGKFLKRLMHCSNDFFPFSVIEPIINSPYKRLTGSVKDLTRIYNTQYSGNCCRSCGYYVFRNGCENCGIEYKTHIKYLVEEETRIL
jgi:hypothetical protein